MKVRLHEMVLTQDEYTSVVNDIYKTEDYYLEHMIDDLLIDILRDGGWDKLADEYESTYKWRA